MQPLDDDLSSRRSSIKFSSVIAKREYDPEGVFSEQEQHDENVFRVPRGPPPSCLKKKREPLKSPLKTNNTPAINVQMSISPGTSANENKQAAVLKRLEKRRISNQQKWAKEKEEAPQRIDIEATERSFLEQSFEAPPEPRFSDISSILPSETFSCPTDTFVVTTPRRSAGPVCSTPFRKLASPKNPPRKLSYESKSPVVNSSNIFNQSAIYESAEDIADRQFNALSVWCNMLLNTCNRFEDNVTELGKTKQDATKRLQELLSKPGKEAACDQPQKFTYTEFMQRQQFGTLRTKAARAYNEADIPQKIITMMQNNVISVRDGLNVFSDIRLKTTLLHIFLCFHPVWLHLSMETIFGESIDISNGKHFLSTMSQFINTRVFSDPQIMKQKKYAQGTVKMLVTQQGRDALHRHFLMKLCQFLYCAEVCKTAGVIPSDPRLFARKSPYKNMKDVFSELSREVMSASGMSFEKAFNKIGFKFGFQQSYFDDLEYKINSPTDLCDGVMLGKLVEVACSMGRGVVMSKLRNPGGDRIRKVKNVKEAIEQATKAGVDCGNVKADYIVGGNREAILELLWRLVGVFVLASDGNSDELRRESLRLHFVNGEQVLFGDNQTPEEFILFLCQQLGFQLGVTVNSLDDLRDGRFLSTVWRAYNPHGSDVHFYPGSSLFKKVVAAAEAELGLPVGLHGALPLFVHMFLTRIFNIRRINEAASRIQRAFRKHLIRKRFKAFLNSEEAEALRAQRDHRLSLLKQETFVVQIQDSLSFENGDCSIHEKNESARDTLMRLMAEQQEKSAVMIQALARGYLARKLFRALKEEHMRALEEERRKEEERLEEERRILALKMEEERRMEEERLEKERILAEKMEEERRIAQATLEEKSACVLQRTFRCHVARKRFAQLQEEHKQFIEKVTVLQSYIRGFLSRKRFEQLRKERLEYITAVIRCQASVRKLLAKRKVALMKKEGEEFEKRVILLQASIRGYLARRLFKKLCIERDDYIRKVIVIQNLVRAFFARMRLKKLRDERERLTRSAVIIQSVARGFLARKRLAELREDHERYVANVIRVQCAVRRFLAKRKVEAMKKEKQMLLKEQNFLAKVIIIQSVVRRFLALREFSRLKVQKEAEIEEERKKVEEERVKLELERSAAVIQRAFRCYLARKRLVQLKDERQRYVANVIRVQSAVRGFLARRRVGQQLEQSIREITSQEVDEEVSGPKEQEIQQASIPTPSRAPSSAEILEKLRRLYVETKKLKLRQAACAKALRTVSRKKKQAEKETAALKIQKYWRGYRVRRDIAREIEMRREFMDKYKEDMAVLEQPEASPTPAVQRLTVLEQQLFDASLYKVKVAATVINRMVHLSPNLCDHFVFNCNGIVAVLDRLEQCDRSPPMQEIVSVCIDILLHVVVTAESNAAMQEQLVQWAGDIQNVIFHEFHAFYLKEDVVEHSARILVVMRQFAPDVRHKKADFYIMQAEKRFARLPVDDVKRRAVDLLRQAF